MFRPDVFGFVKLRIFRQQRATQFRCVQVIRHSENKYLLKFLILNYVLYEDCCKLLAGTCHIFAKYIKKCRVLLLFACSFR